MKNKKKNLQDVELYLLDLDGTVYIGDKEIPGAFETVRKLRSAGKRVCFFTNNSSRTHLDYVEKLTKMGLPVTAPEIYTSGQASAEFIAERFPGARVFLLGNEKLKTELALYGVTCADNDPDILLLGFDTSLTYDKLYKFCGYVAAGLPYIATHPDDNCPAEPCPMPDAGVLIEAVRMTVKRFPDFIAGKPYTIAGDGVKKRFGLSPEKIAMVGDRLYTDIKFGINNGFVSILVLSGETTAAAAAESDTKADFIFDSLPDIAAALGI
ncbi:MAG: HAD-IIA family hydrolase [Clostridiales bacterium]|jgi:NagD protein|nr:HAD-IIA family hydrolase [Clostridiales bacterium]